MYNYKEVIIKLNQEELANIDEEGNFLKEFIGKIESLSEEKLIVLLEEGIESLSFSLEYI